MNILTMNNNLPDLLREDEALFGNMLQVIIVLIVIIGLILVLLKFLSKKNRQWMGNRAIRLLGGVQLGQQKSLQMVEIGHTIYLIGVGEDVQLITKIEDEEEIATIMMLLENEEHSLKTFNWFSKPRAEKEHHSFEEIFNEKMKRVSNRGKRVQEILEEDKNKDRWSSKE